ncbi:MAG: UDP-N-acetylmuramyl-tripeptide synthetase [bacterium]|nr:UDP-N-acetylmuramyl-tripeptide synthetase [bacterium]
MSKKLRTILAPGILLYHYMIALLGALIYRFPSRNIRVIGVTGTKGKSTTAEIIYAILKEAGHQTALAGTIRFVIGENSSRNLSKMTMPGRFFLQKFLRDAVRQNCSYAVVEMTSEGSRQFRHAFIGMDALVVTNLSPEHIESHGSYKKYVEAKLAIARSLLSSSKQGYLVLNQDDGESARFAKLDPNRVTWFSLHNVVVRETTIAGSLFDWKGECITLHLPGKFNISNALAAATIAQKEGVGPGVIKSALEKIQEIPGRTQLVQETPFLVVVDYAHTVDSLTKLYEAFPQEQKICVLGSCGGGRDSWKRKLMGEVADKYCNKVILTNEDPYDEDPLQIVKQVGEGVSKEKLEIIMDRKQAIARAFSYAKPGDCVLITGKGTDPYIMGPRGSKVPWDDATVARELL